jgi:hypothetical protein
MRRYLAHSFQPKRVSLNPKNPPAGVMKLRCMSFSRRKKKRRSKARKLKNGFYTSPNKRLPARSRRKRFHEYGEEFQSRMDRRSKITTALILYGF